MDRSEAGLVRRDRLHRAAGRRPRAHVRRSRERPAETTSRIWSAADVLDVVMNIGVPILGIVIVNKRPRNAIGWIFIVAGAALALASFGQAYALHVLLAEPGTLPAGRALAWLSNVLWPIPLVALDPAVPPVPDRTSPVCAMASRRLARDGHLRPADDRRADPRDGRLVGSVRGHQRGPRGCRRPRARRDRDRRPCGDRRAACCRWSRSSSASGVQRVPSGSS